MLVDVIKKYHCHQKCHGYMICAVVSSQQLSAHFTDLSTLIGHNSGWQTDIARYPLDWWLA